MTTENDALDKLPLELPLREALMVYAKRLFWFLVVLFANIIIMEVYIIILKLLGKI